MSSETGLELQFFDIDAPATNGPTAKLLLLGGVGSLSPSSPPRMDAALSALLAAHDLVALSLLADTTNEDSSASGAAAAEWAAGIGADFVSIAGLESETPPEASRFPGNIERIGAGETEAEAFRPLVKNHNGVRIGVLALAERRAGGFDGHADILHPLACDRVRMLQAQCDHVVVFCHAGLPKANLPLPEWRARYRRLVDSGASVVVGQPPAGVSGWEEYRHGLVFYGLGTLADDREGADARSLALSLKLGQNGRFTYEVHMLERDCGMLRFCESEAAKQSINEINTLFFDEKEYLTRCRALCCGAYDAWTRETCAAHAKGIGRGLLNALLPQSADNAKREDEAQLKALLENESLRLAVFRALVAREAEEQGGRA